MIDLFKFKRAPSVLGLALDGNRLEAVVLRRSNGTLVVRQSVSAPLALSPLTDDAELAGREIRNCLDAAGIRERRCAVCLPLNWLLTLQTKVPDLPESDRASFLQLEAERGFHSGPEGMFTAQSLFQPAAGEQYATLLAVPRDNLSTLERVLRAARLKPVTFGLGIAVVQPAAADTQRVITLLVRGSGIDLQVSGGGGIVALRSLDSAIEAQGAVKQISAEFVAREIRITLGQLPGGLAAGPGKIRIVGQGEMTRQFVHEISPRLVAMGLTVEASDRSFSANLDKTLPADVAVSPAVPLAAAWVGGRDTTPEFLPPKVRPWQQMLSKGMSTRKLVWAGEAAAAVVGCVLLAFLVQQVMLWHLRGKWKDKEPKVTQLTAMQDQIKEFRDFYNQAEREALIWERLATVFPRDNSVSLKSLEVRDMVNVTCSGVARDNDAFNKVFSKLSDDTNEISNVHPEVSGQRPMQFTLSFVWEQEERQMEAKNREKLLMIAAGACVGLWLLNLLVISPLIDSWKDRSAEITGLKKKIDDGAGMIRREAFIRSRWDSMRTNALASNPTAAERKLFTSFDHWVGASRVTEGSFRPQFEGTDTNYSTIECRADVSGDIGRIAAFLVREMARDPVAVKLGSFELTTRDTNGRQLTLGMNISGLVLPESTNKQDLPVVTPAAPTPTPVSVPLRVQETGAASESDQDPYGMITLNNIFDQTRIYRTTRPPSGPYVAPPRVQYITYHGSSIDDKGGVAMLDAYGSRNKWMFRTGDSVGDLKIVRIELNSVTLTNTSEDAPSSAGNGIPTNSSSNASASSSNAVLTNSITNSLASSSNAVPTNSISNTVTDPASNALASASAETPTNSGGNVFVLDMVKHPTLRREGDGPWQISGYTGPATAAATYSSSSTNSETATTSAAASSGGTDSVIERLKKKREQDQ